MRISDWSSDVCSSDLRPPPGPRTPVQRVAARRKAYEDQPAIADRDQTVPVYIGDMAGAAAQPGDDLDHGPRRPLQPIAPIFDAAGITILAASQGIADRPVAMRLCRAGNGRIPFGDQRFVQPGALRPAAADGVL